MRHYTNDEFKYLFPGGQAYTVAFIGRSYNRSNNVIASYLDGVYDSAYCFLSETEREDFIEDVIKGIRVPSHLQ